MHWVKTIDDVFHQESLSPEVSWYLVNNHDTVASIEEWNNKYIVSAVLLEDDKEFNSFEEARNFCESLARINDMEEGNR